ncbi:DUF1028 domain-containing protein [Pseudactinotalea sp.]|uniref:DUF1028 domain-containing protein n=1 Tax=Pseudactinotalea sp. TaxID=1926260 RepID=UPI003B3AFBC4
MTFTLLAADTRSGMLAAATASRSLAVGNAVIAIDPAAGAVASQAWTNRSLRARMLTALADGLHPAEVMAAVPTWDEEPERRQVAALLPSGEADSRTGTATSPWAGAVVRRGLVALGNLLTGPEVLAAMVEAYEAEAEHTAGASAAAGVQARRVLIAMQAGEAAGGDRRGRQSAAVMVARVREHRQHPPDLDLDLRVDNAEDPLAELARLVELSVRTG